MISQFISLKMNTASISKKPMLWMHQANTDIAKQECDLVKLVIIFI